ncbi:cytochrome c oxidase subunit II transmembrane domain-containing protein [Altericista sp. CCNU0014]|uniref:cytochrome c oxidase subunit II transmembrane domain-containing protein n=1 Tax=Altericista sp. CCNU0014 TaxID=3082949 RepID=UPI00384EFDC7
MKQIPTSLLTLVAGVLIALVSFWVGQNHPLLPEQASEQAALVDNFFNVTIAIATALFIVVQGAILLFAIRFRRRKGDDTDGHCGGRNPENRANFPPRWGTRGANAGSIGFYA